MLPLILLGVAAVPVVVVALAATRPAAYHVERTLEIAAPADRVFAALADLKGFAAVLFLFGEPWDGAGELTLVESVAGRKVAFQLVLVKPMASTVRYTISVAAAPAGASVTWAMDGSHNLLGKTMGLFMNMDRALGGDIEKGLARLKAASEG